MMIELCGLRIQHVTIRFNELVIARRKDARWIMKCRWPNCANRKQKMEAIRTFISDDNKQMLLFGVGMRPLAYK